MSKRKPADGIEVRRGEIWFIKDDEGDQKKEASKYKDSRQQGSRMCIIVSNNSCNRFSSVVEVVYTTRQTKVKLPTHFITESTPRRSTVLCEQIDSVPKRKLKKCHGKLTLDEIKVLNRCLKISLDL